MGDSKPADILCESCARIIHTNLQSCMSIFSETLHDHHMTSEESLRDFKLPVTGYLRAKGQESVHETCDSHYSTRKFSKSKVSPKKNSFFFGRGFNLEHYYSESCNLIGQLEVN